MQVQLLGHWHRVQSGALESQSVLTTPGPDPPPSRSKQMVLQSPQAKAHFIIAQDEDMHICKIAATIATTVMRKKAFSVYST